MKASTLAEKAVTQLEILLPAFQQRVVAPPTPHQMMHASSPQQQLGAYAPQTVTAPVDHANLVEAIKTAMREMQSAAPRGQLFTGGFGTPQSGSGRQQPRTVPHMQTPVSGGWYSPYEIEMQAGQDIQSQDQREAPAEERQVLEQLQPGSAPRRVSGGLGTSQSNPRMLATTRMSSTTGNRPNYQQQCYIGDDSQGQGRF